MPINFALALALFNMTSVRAARVVLTLYALNLGAQSFAIGVLAATFAIFPVLLSWLSGRLSDRFGSRWPLLCGAAGGVAGMLLPYFVPQLPAVFVAAAMSGLSQTFYNVPLQNLVGQLSRPQDRARNFSNYSLVGALTSFIGPLLAGFSIDHWGYSLACMYVVLLSLLPVAMLAIWGGALPGGSRASASAGRIGDTLADPGVWRVLGASSLAQTGNDLFQFYMPVYARAIDLSATAIGVVLAMFAVAGFAVRVALPRLVRWLTEEKVLAYAFYLGAGSFMLVPLCTGVVTLALVSFLFGLGMGCGQPITMMLMFTRSAEGRSGEALGLRLTADNLTRLVGPVVFGSIGSALGLPFVFWINALMLGSGGVLSGAGRRDEGRRRT